MATLTMVVPVGVLFAVTLNVRARPVVLAATEVSMKVTVFVVLL